VVVIVQKMQDVVERFAADHYEELEKAAAELDRLESRADDTKESILGPAGCGDPVPPGSSRSGAPGGSMDGIANLATGAVDRISMRKFTLPQA